MQEPDRLAQRFETHRDHLRAVAHRMLGSRPEADDAVQEAWLRLSRSDVSGVENLAGWLTTVVSRVCLDMLRSRRSRRETPLVTPLSGPDLDGDGGGSGNDPADRAVLDDSVGIALLVVLERLNPAERVAFVLHDLFAVPFDEIAPIVERTPTTTKKMASRARQRVRGPAGPLDPTLARNRQVVDAFLAATRGGDVGALLAVLAPDVVRRADRLALPAGAATKVYGAQAVAEDAARNALRARFAGLALVDGAVGLVVARPGQPLVVLSLVIDGDRITEIDVIADPARLRGLTLTVLPAPEM